jgi:hypothetical protein
MWVDTQPQSLYNVIINGKSTMADIKNYVKQFTWNGFELSIPVNQQFRATRRNTLEISNVDILRIAVYINVANKKYYSDMVVYYKDGKGESWQSSAFGYVYNDAGFLEDLKAFLKQKKFDSGAVDMIAFDDVTMQDVGCAVLTANEFIDSIRSKIKD